MKKIVLAGLLAAGVLMATGEGPEIGPGGLSAQTRIQRDGPGDDLRGGIISRIRGWFLFVPFGPGGSPFGG